ncbi:hypothetical protein PENSUB_6858 [Penicillium subrubescens]|uniref:Major facilitator superfamily (MFS) profile domain-containing protein n=1 Tax=Penicillium subrubescens TaxID=1316194 RepID=A0A1Q5TTZ5_9EURO|nr:hypothetical protein PENSUB_6858 [Penicillium subrubescens]
MVSQDRYKKAFATIEELSKKQKMMIICRAFQGLGGAGVYTLTLFSFVRIVPYNQYDKASSLGGGILSLGLVLGPLLGGAIAIGTAFQATGLFLFSEIASKTELWPGQFGYLVLAGLGVGLAMSAFYMAAPLVVDEEDQSTALGIGIQLRMLGGVLGVAASTTILYHFLESRLSSNLRPWELRALLKTTEALAGFPPEIQLRVRVVYAIAYNMQVKLSAAFSVGQLLAVAMIWKRQNVRYLKGSLSN